MANLTLAVGAITATISTSNARAQALLTEFVAATGGDINSTNQEQLDHVLAMLKKYIVDRAKDQSRMTRRNARDAAIETELSDFEW